MTLDLISKIGLANLMGADSQVIKKIEHLDTGERCFSCENCMHGHMSVINMVITCVPQWILWAEDIEKGASFLQRCSLDVLTRSHGSK